MKPSSENDSLYGAVDTYDPSIIDLAKSIKKNGLHDPLIVTRDGYIVSGHRRFAAVKLIGQGMVPCRVLDVRRRDLTRDEYVSLLRDCNRQRSKSAADQIREEMVDIDPDEAVRNLHRLRREQLHGYKRRDVEVLKIEGEKRRWNISDEKAEHVAHIKKVVFEDRSEYWPMSVRGIHYPLLNYTFYRNTRLKLAYKNDDKSYDATSDLLTRLRITGEIPWEAITDETRPVTTFSAFQDVREYIRQELTGLLTGYWRDLLQTQPNYIEVLCEKNTVYSMATSVTRRYQIPTTSARGFASIDPWHEVYERYEASGKERMILIVLSDFDPEGEMIPHVAGRTLKGDFGVGNLEIIKAGVTREQIDSYSLPPQNFAKESSSNHKWFVDRNDGDDLVYELEALEPADMLTDLETTITSVLDMELFNAEVERENDEAITLEKARKQASKALASITG